MPKNYLLAYFLCFGMANSVAAQAWHSVFQKPELTYPTVVSAFQAETKEKEKTTNGEDADSQFYRWEYMMRLRGANIKPFDAQKLVNEYKKIAQNQANANAKVDASESWKPVGPFTNLSPYNGLGRVDCIGFHPTNPNIFYIGTPTGGLWKTIDNGNSWTSLSDNWDFMGVADIAINPTKPDIIYVATGDKNTARTPSVGVLKSLDGGKSWQNLGIANDKNRAYRIVLDPLNADRILLACADGLRISNDAGKTWTNATYPKQAVIDQIWEICFKPNNPKVVYAVTSKQLLVSSDGGNSFMVGNATLNQELATKQIGRLAIAVTPAAPENIYIIASNSSGNYGGYFVSQDGGGTFTLPFGADKTVINGDMVFDINGVPVKETLLRHFGQGTLNLAIAVSPKNPNLVYFGTASLLQTSIKGDTVIVSNTDYNHKVTTPLFLHVDTHAIGFQPGTDELFSGNDGGMYRRIQTTNEFGWKPLGNNLAITQIYHLNASTADGSHLAVGNQDNGFFEYRNGVWANLVAGDGMYAIFDPSNSDHFMMSARCLNIDRKPAKGLISSVAPRDTKESRLWETPFFLYEPNRSLYLGFQNVWKSSNRGDTWQKVTDIKNNIYGFSEFKISPTDSTQWYASYYDEVWQADINGNLKTPLKCFKSSDSGKNWELFGINLEHFTFHPTNANRIWANTGSKIFQSDDKGKTWKDVSLNFPDIKITTMVAQKGTKNGLWIGAIRGVYYKDDEMATWQLYSKDLPNVEITDLSVDYATNKLITSTYGRGVWSVDLIKIVGGKLKDLKVSNKVLCKNTAYDLSFSAEDFPLGTSFKIQLSGNDGTFANPTDLITSKETKASISIPASVLVGENYKIRVMAVDYPTVLDAPSETVTINESPKGTLSANAPSLSILPGADLTLNLAFTKGLPNWNYELSEGTKGTSSVASTTIIVKPTVSTVYTIKSLNNTCGVGTTDGKVEVTMLVVTGLNNSSEKWLSVYPNPAQDLLFVQLLNEEKGSCELLDMSGKMVLTQQLSNSETLELKGIAPGIFFLKVNAGVRQAIIKVIKL